MKVKLFACSVLLGAMLLPFGLYAQKYEAHLYAGGFWPSKNDAVGRFQSDGIYGAKAGMFITPNLELGTHFGYINHFEPSGRSVVEHLNAINGIPRHSVRGLLWEMGGDYHFHPHRLFGGPGITPYVTLGVGGLRAAVSHGDFATLAGGLTANESGLLQIQPTRFINDGDRWFTFSYGGGIKAMRISGPMGLRADIRGRTLPNFFGKPTSWPEVSGGLMFSWGER